MDSTKIRTFFQLQRINMLYVILFIVLLVVFDTTRLVVDSNLLINLDPQNALSVFTHSWDSTFGFGQSSNWSTVYLFPNLISRLLLFEVFGQRLGQSIYFSLIFILGVWGIHYLVNTLFFFKEKKWFNRKNGLTQEIMLFLSGLFYVSNVYFILLFVSSTTMTYAHIALPFQIGLLIRIFRDNDGVRANCFMFAIATLLMSGTSPPYILINLFVLICIVFYDFLLLKINKKNWLEFLLRKIFKLCALVFITVAINAIWILPMVVHFYTMSGSDIASAMIETPEMHNRQTSYVNIFRNMGLWAFGDGYGDVDYYNFSDAYLHQNDLQLVFFVGTALLIFSSITKKSRKTLPFLLIYVLFVPLAVGINQGVFANVYRWIYDNVPGFVIFRGSYKFVGILILSQSVGIAGIVFYLKKSSKLVVGGVLLLLVLILINGFPLWSKRIFEEGRFISNVPQHYHDAGDYFAKDGTSYRIWLLPDQYLGFYKWGRIGSNVEVIWRKPLIARLATSPLHPMNIAVDQLMQSLRENDLDAIRKLTQELNIKYVVVRDDALWDYYPDLSVSKNKIKSVFQEYRSIRIGALTIYSVPEFIDARIQGEGVRSFSQVSPTLYRIILRCDVDSEKATIKFLEKMNSGWGFYAVGLNDVEKSENWFSQQAHYLSLLKDQRLPSIKNHSTSLNINEWNVDVSSAPCQAEGRNIYMYYTAQTAITLGILITTLSCAATIAYFIILGSRHARV